MSLSLRLQSLSLGGCRPSALGSRAAARGQAVVPRGARARRVGHPHPQLTCRAAGACVASASGRTALQVEAKQNSKKRVRQARNPTPCRVSAGAEACAGGQVATV